MEGSGPHRNPSTPSTLTVAAAAMVRGAIMCPEAVAVIVVLPEMEVAAARRARVGSFNKSHISHFSHGSYNYVSVVAVAVTGAGAGTDACST